MSPVPKRSAPKRKSAPKAKGKPKAAPRALGAVKLPAESGSRERDMLKSDLKRVLTRSAPVTVDAGALVRCDAATLQLLAAFVRERAATNRTVVWQALPESLEQAARRLGLTAALGVARA